MARVGWSWAFPFPQVTGAEWIWCCPSPGHLGSANTRADLARVS